MALLLLCTNYFRHNRTILFNGEHRDDGSPTSLYQLLSSQQNHSLQRSTQRRWLSYFFVPTTFITTEPLSSMEYTETMALLLLCTNYFRHNRTTLFNGVHRDDGPPTSLYQLLSSQQNHSLQRSTHRRWPSYFFVLTTFATTEPLSSTEYTETMALLLLCTNYFRHNRTTLFNGVHRDDGPPTSLY